jgi:hypothetical protein
VRDRLADLSGLWVITVFLWAITVFVRVFKVLGKPK